MRANLHARFGKEFVLPRLRYAALEPGGKLIVHDFMVDNDQRGPGNNRLQIITPYILLSSDMRWTYPRGLHAG